MYEAAVEIHWGTVSVDSFKCIPTEIGLIDTVAMQCSEDTLSEKFVKCVIPKIYKSCLVDYEASEDNYTMVGDYGEKEISSSVQRCFV